MFESFEVLLAVLIALLASVLGGWLSTESGWRRARPAGVVALLMAVPASLAVASFVTRAVGAEVGVGVGAILEVIATALIIAGGIAAIAHR